jgi:adenine-specific DNA methylase
MSITDPSTSSGQDRRFIEESFPVKEVGEASAREKNIRHGHISTLHIWWARRPLAASRATAYAALTPAPKDIEEWDKQRKFIIELSRWENSNNQSLLERARKAILEAHAARLSEETGKLVTVEDIEAGRAPRPRVLDPFAGGGSYPLEALRLGCEAYANDYNPVAVLIEKATLEYPQKFGRPFEGMPEWAYPSPPIPLSQSPEMGQPSPPIPLSQSFGRGGAGGEGSAGALIERARQLRKEATSAEELLWQLLRNRQLLGRKFRRQHPIGPFITDFFCDDARLIIEIDGAIHQEVDQKQRDLAREEILRAYNYHILRFSNHEVLHETERVLDEIARFTQTHSYEHPPQPTQSQRRDHAGAAAQLQLFETGPAASQHDFNPLLNAVRYWGNWVLEEAREELAEFYPPDPNGSIPVGYIWARTLPCQNPACGVEIPLMRQFWLAKKDKKKIALRPLSRGAGEPIAFDIVAQNQPGYAPWTEDFDPEDGSVSRAVVTCPACGAVIDANTTRRLFRQVGANGRSPAGQRMVAVVTTGVGAHGRAPGGKTYRLPTEADLAAYRAAEAALQAQREQLRPAWGLEPLPDEPLPPQGTLGFRVQGYGIDTWGDLFNPRQALALLTFADAVRRAHAQMLAQGYPEDFARAVATYLGIIFNRLADKNANVVVYNVVGEKIEHVFGRQALPMVWDYVEVNPFTDVGWPNMLDWVVNVLDHLTHIPAVPGGEHPHPHFGGGETPPSPLVGEGPGVRVTHASATRLPYPDGTFDAVLTDPPYYDNVPYSYLSDFFYVWLKRTVGHLYPELFITPLTPKVGEIVAYSHGEGGFEAGKRFFEEQLAAAFRESARVLKPGGVAVVVYAHKSTAGWETVINALLDSGLVVSAAWPLNTEMESRLRANESAALASSIYIVVRKMPRQPTGFYNDVRQELQQHLNAKLQRLWEEGIGGADFFIAAIGSAIEVFGKYEKVMDYEGNIVRADRLLEEVRAIATHYAVRQILHNGFAAEITPLARFYVLWRWNYGEALVPFDEANKLAHSCGLDLSLQFGKGGSIKKEKEFVRLLGPQARKLDDLDEPRDLIDVLHKSLLLWEKGQRAEMVKALTESGFGRSEAFYRVAQAISETLPLESKEKKLLDGFLAGRERVQQEVEKEGKQGKLWE